MRRAAWGVVVVTVLSFMAGCRKEAERLPTVPRAVRAITLEEAKTPGERQYAATLQPRVSVELPFKVGGRVAALGEVREGRTVRPLQAGDRVEKGQLLARLDPSDLRRNERAAHAAWQSARAQAAAARGALAQAERERARARTLAASETIAPAELERAEAAWAAAVANQDAAAGQTEAKREQFELARAALQDAGLRSPLSGVIARRTVEVGELAAPGKPAFVIVDTRELKVVFGVPDTRVSQLRPGEPVQVTVDAFPGQPFAGAVARIDPLADPALRSFTVEVTIPNPEGRLRAGMVAGVSLGGAAGGRSLLVPLSSVLRDPKKQGGFAVYRLQEDRTVALTPVSLGDLDGNRVAVEAGLSPGARVITDGAPLLHEGERVEVVP